VRFDRQIVSPIRDEIAHGFVGNSFDEFERTPRICLEC
jgi:hypothetical protein